MAIIKHISCLVGRSPRKTKGAATSAPSALSGVSQSSDAHGPSRKHDTGVFVHLPMDLTFEMIFVHKGLRKVIMNT